MITIHWRLNWRQGRVQCCMFAPIFVCARGSQPSDTFAQRPSMAMLTGIPCAALFRSPPAIGGQILERNGVCGGLVVAMSGRIIRGHGWSQRS